MVSTVEDWESKFGSNDKFLESNRIGFDFELNVAYPVTIKSAKIIKNKRDEVVLLLDLIIQDKDRTERLGSSREWFPLPKQPTDDKLPPETVRKLTFRRRDELQRILSCASSTYSVYTERRVEDGKTIYLDGNGKELTGTALRDKEKQVNEAVMNQSDTYHESVGDSLRDLEGVEFYLVKAPNKRNADYPYTNIYNIRPANLPVIGEDRDLPF